MWTDQTIRSLKPKNRRYRVSDNLGQRGAGKLVLDIQPNGIKTFFYQYFRTQDGLSKRVLIKVGQYKDKTSVPGVSLSEARAQAIRFSEMASQSDLKTQLEKQAAKEEAEAKRSTFAAQTLSSVLEDYISHKDLKQGTITDYRKALTETFSNYLDRPITDVTRDIVLRLYRKRSRKSVARANNAIRVFRAIYNYQRAVTRLRDGSYLLPENPVSILQETKVTKKLKRRQSYIPREILPIWFGSVLALDDSQFSSGSTIRDYLIFVLLTGARKEEARLLTRKDVDLLRNTFTLRDTKNKEVIELPMSDYLADLVKTRLNSHSGKYVFAGETDNVPFVSFKRPLDHVRSEINLKFTIHDLRRTFITVAESLDISVYTYKRLVNHKFNDTNDVTVGYVVVDIERMREATEKISNQILKLANII